MKKTSILTLIVLMVSTILACGTKNPEPDNKPNPEESEHPENPEIPSPDGIRVMVYNIRHGQGMDNLVNLNRVLDVIKDSEAEIVALNEVDRHYGARSNYEDQVKMLADILEMHYVFQPTTTNPPNPASGDRPREHGHALLSKYPIVDSEQRELAPDDWGRGILRAKLDIDGEHLQVFVTHWGLTEAVRFNHIKETVMFMNDYPGKSILMGDLNATPDEHNIIALKSRLIDATEDNAYTFNAENPSRKIDYIFVSRDIDVSGGKVISTTASDHRPIVVDINLDKEIEIDNSLLYPNFPESFEIADGNFIGYEGGERVRTFPSGAWNFTQAAIVNTRIVYDDRPTTGIDAIRIRQNLTTSAYVQMDFDVPNGASKVTVWYSVYFKDVSSTWRLEYSTDGGTTWTQTGSDISDAGFIKKQAVFNMDITGPVRFRINKLGLGATNNGRLCIDDFAIYKK